MNPADSWRQAAPAEPLLVALRSGENTTGATPDSKNDLRAQFRWAGDRYVHRISVGSAPIMQTVLREPTLDWPDDPPVQQLSIEELGEQTVAFGVGAAGTSHWSLSIEALPGPAPALRYDVACRCRIPPDRLASTFEMLANGARFAIDDAETAVIEGVASGTIQIRPEPSIGPVRWKESEAGRVLSLAADLGGSPSPGTFRWGFRIVWQPH